MAVDELLRKWDWKPIHNCPGRFVLAAGLSNLPPETLIGGEAEVFDFDAEAARDKVIVVRLADGGLISYRRADGTYVHTLNTAEGLARKMSQLGIVLR